MIVTRRIPTPPPLTERIDYMAKKYFSLIVVTLCAAGAAFGALGSVLGSFEAPEKSIRGLAHSGTYLHVLMHPKTVYNLNPNNGSVYGSWTTPSTNNNRGLAYTATGHVWVGSHDNDTVYNCIRPRSPADGRRGRRRRRAPLERQRPLLHLASSAFRRQRHFLF
jgi:hypothetical protein